MRRPLSKSKGYGDKLYLRTLEYKNQGEIIPLSEEDRAIGHRIKNMIYTREKAKTIDELYDYIASEDRVKVMAEKGLRDYYRVRNGNDITVLWKKKCYSAV